MKGENLLDWSTFRLPSPLKSGDVVGCGWLREGEGAKGNVYFTLNGIQMENRFSDVPAEMTPFLHIQKKACYCDLYIHVRIRLDVSCIVGSSGKSQFRRSTVCLHTRPRPQECSRHRER